MRCLLLFSLCLPLCAQWSASFAPTNSITLTGTLGRSLPGVSVYTANICSGRPTLTLTPGQILIEVHRRDLVIFDGKSLDALLTYSQGTSPSTVVLDISEAVALGGGIVTSTDAISMRDPVRKKLSFSLFLFAGLSHWLHGKLKTKALDPVKLYGLALPSQVVLNGVGSCWTGTVLGITHPAVSFMVP